MKYFNKWMVFFLFVLIGYGVDTFTYTYKIYNGTDKDVKVQLRWTSGNLGKEKVIRAGSRHTFHIGGWEIGLCLYKIMVRQKRLKGSWGRAKKARIRSVRESDLKVALLALGFTTASVGAISTGLALGMTGRVISLIETCPQCIGAAFATAAAAYGIYYAIDTSMCRGRNFSLVVNPKTAEVEANYVR